MGPPIISIFYGIVIRINFSDHNPPHLHAAYGDTEALFEIRTAKVIAGQLPRREMRYVVEWMLRHRDDLMRNWELAASKQPTFKIEGLDDE